MGQDLRLRIKRIRLLTDMHLRAKLWMTNRIRILNLNDPEKSLRFPGRNGIGNDNGD